MKIYGIISEYNPLHNGHVYQINKVKEQGATHIVSVMSGNFVQRGDVAVLDKFTRADLAVKNGIDLVLELPVTYCLSTAENFAYGGISLLDKLGCIDFVSFGSESGDISSLKKCAEISDEFSNSKELIEKLENGNSYPSVMQKMCREKYGDELAQTFSSPNNLLGIEYIKALNKLRSKIIPTTIARKNVLHDSEVSAEEFASASLIRKNIDNINFFNKFTPCSVSEEIKNALNHGDIADITNLENAILYKLRSMSEKDFLMLSDVSQGLENRLFKAVKKSNSLEEILFNTKTKRYPLAKIRRIVISALLNISQKDVKIELPYGRILAFNEKGCEILKEIKKLSSIPVDTSLKSLSKTSKEALILSSLESKATDIYNLSTNNIKKCGMDYTQKIVKS